VYVLVYNKQLLPVLLMLTYSEMAVCLKCVVTFESFLQLSDINIETFIPSKTQQI